MDLSTEEALVRLRNSLKHFEHVRMSKALIGKKSVFGFPGHESLLFGFYASSSLLLLAAFFLGLDSLNYFTVSVLLSLLVATSLVTFWLIRRRNDITHNHLSYDVTKLCEDLDRTLQIGFNKAIFYPQFNIPSYLGSSLQWAIRDGETVAVPRILLVHGDIILLTPGQVIPTECVPVNPVDKDANSTFFSNSIYSPQPSTPLNHRQDSQFSLELPHHPIKAMVTLSPLVGFMRQHKMTKPSAHNQFAPNFYSFITLILILSLMTKLLLCILYFLVSFSRVLLYNHSFSHSSAKYLLSSGVLSMFSHFLFCVSGLGLTCTWFCALAFVSTKFKRTYEAVTRCALSCGAISSRRPASSLTSSLSMESNTRVSSAAWVKSARGFTSCARTFWSEFYVSPDVNVQHSLLMLGAVSSVCCVDQEGILSRPIPTPEKIFFFHKRHHHHRRQHHHQLHWSHWNMSQPGAAVQKAYEASIPNPSVTQRSSRAGFAPPLSDGLSTGGARCSIASHHDLQNARPLVSPFEYRCSQVASFSSYSEDRYLLNEAHTPQLVPVVLDLRTDAYWPYLTHFEKPRWSRYMASLKPLGLCLMLNNCHSSVAHERRVVANHVLACESHLLNTSTQPDRFGLLSFCLCSLARQIGFRAGAVDGFVRCGCVAGYQIGPQPNFDWPYASQIEESNILHIRDARSHIGDDQWICPQGSCMARVCFSAIFHNPESNGGCHLMSQGAGDLLSSLCTDLWDGKDVSPLREPERCALLDFSNRNASAAYCLGLAYAPLLERPKLRSVSTQLTQNGSFRKHWSPSGDGAVMDTVLLRIPKGYYIQHKKINTGRTPSTTGTYCRLCVPQSGLTSAQFLAESPVPQSDSAPFFSTRSNHTTGLTEVLNDPVPLNRCSITDDVESTHLSSVPHNAINNVGVNDRRSFRSVPAGRRPCPVERVILDTSLDPLSRNCSQECEDLYESETPCKSWQRAYSCCESIRNEMNLKENSQSLHNLEKSHEGNCGSDSTTGVEEAQSLLENQIFLGLVSLQYQVNAHVVDTIQHLGQSCIRFVYFSRENELRSRVFAERLGLECGWNCHISLASPTMNAHSRRSSANSEARLRKTSSGTPPVRAGLLSTLRMDSDLYLSHHVDQPSEFKRIRSVPLMSAAIRTSLLDLPHTVSSPGIPDYDPNSDPPTDQSSVRECASPTNFCAQDLCQLSSSSLRTKHHGNNHIPSALPLDSVVHEQSSTPSSFESSNNSSNSGSSSSSSNTSSTNGSSTNGRGVRLSDYVTDNKSRLPCGIANIRPHLATVDNVPLQVSLFTDCTPQTTQEMITILQEHGETVCTIGSCYSMDTIRLLAQGDVAIAVRPLLPQPCTVFSEFPVHDTQRTLNVQTCRKLNPIVSTPRFHLRSLGSVFHSSRKEHFAGKFDPVSPKTVHTQFGQDQSYSACSDAFELTARLVKLLFPWVLDMNTQGFRVCELIHEARCSVNNLYWVIACSVLMPLSAALLQLLLLSAGLPSLPLVLANASSSSVHLVWLPQQQFRAQLMFLPYQQMWNSSWESFLSPDVIHFNSAYCIPSYGVGQLIWLILIVTPVLSLSMLDRRVDLLRPLQEPPVKRRTSFDLKKCVQNGVFLGIRILPSLLVCFACALGHFLLAPGFDHCYEVVSVCLTSNCSMEMDVYESNNVSVCFTRLTVLMDIVKDIVYSQLILYLVLISFTYANFGQRIWKFRWSTNPSWCFSAFIFFVSQSMYIIIRCFQSAPFLDVPMWHILSPSVLGFGLSWCPLLIMFNEMVAWKEQQLLRTEHRLARLYFGTKLGMYSPV